MAHSKHPFNNIISTLIVMLFYCSGFGFDTLRVDAQSLEDNVLKYDTRALLQSYESQAYTIIADYDSGDEFKKVMVDDSTIQIVPNDDFYGDNILILLHGVSPAGDTIFRINMYASFENVNDAPRNKKPWPLIEIHCNDKYSLKLEDYLEDPDGPLEEEEAEYVTYFENSYDKILVKSKTSLEYEIMSNGLIEPQHRKFYLNDNNQNQPEKYYFNLEVNPNKQIPLGELFNLDYADYTSGGTVNRGHCFSSLDSGSIQDYFINEDELTISTYNINGQLMNPRIVVDLAGSYKSLAFVTATPDYIVLKAGGDWPDTYIYLTRDFMFVRTELIYSPSVYQFYSSSNYYIRFAPFFPGFPVSFSIYHIEKDVSEIFQFEFSANFIEKPNGFSIIYYTSDGYKYQECNKFFEVIDSGVVKHSQRKDLTKSSAKITEINGLLYFHFRNSDSTEVSYLDPTEMTLYSLDHNFSYNIRFFNAGEHLITEQSLDGTQEERVLWGNGKHKLKTDQITSSFFDTKLYLNENYSFHWLNSSAGYGLAQAWFQNIYDNPVRIVDKSPKSPHKNQYKILRKAQWLIMDDNTGRIYNLKGMYHNQ